MLYPRRLDIQENTLRAHLKILKCSSKYIMLFGPAIKFFVRVLQLNNLYDMFCFFFRFFFVFQSINFIELLCSFVVFFLYCIKIPYCLPKERAYCIPSVFIIYKYANRAMDYNLWAKAVSDTISWCLLTNLIINWVVLYEWLLNMIFDRFLTISYKKLYPVGL